MIRLGARLAAGGGREALVRLALTGAGLALAVVMLLTAAVVLPALHAHDVRRAWTETGPDNRQPAQDEATTDPLLWRLAEDRFDGHDLLRLDVAAEGPDAPVPPGLDRLPGPGEVAVSPELRDLLASTDPALLADRFPGRVTATVGRAALASPDDLVVVVGRAPDELRDEPGVVAVRGIEAAPISHGFTQAMRVVIAVGGVGLLAPVVVFVATATRLAAARRERRLAALRLAGATTGQVGVVAAVEAAVAALGGTAVGFLGFLAARPRVARIPFDGAAFYPSDLRLSLGWAVLVAVGVPALAIGAAIVALRRVRISPLGVARRARPSRATARPLLLVAAGMAGLALVVTWDNASDSSSSENTAAIAVGVAFLAMVVGIVLSGPWLTATVARGVARFGRRAASLLAARRLQDNPAAGFRAISGIILAVFVGTVFSTVSASILARDDRHASGLAAGVVAGVPQVEAPPGSDLPPPRPTDRVTVAPALVDRLAEDLGDVPGVRGVVTARALPEGPGLADTLAHAGGDDVYAPALVSCADAARLGFGAPCQGTTVLTVAHNEVAATGIAATRVVPLDGLADLPVVAVAAVTDGSVAAVEGARTVLEVGLPGARAVTRADIEADLGREVRTQERISNIGLVTVLVIAGCSLAVAVAGAIVERRQPFALLRLAGTRLAELRRVVLAEAAAPLLVVAAASVGLGLAVGSLVMAAGGGSQGFVLPGPGYWLSLAGGLAAALLVVLSTLPLLGRLTAPDTTRFE